MTNKLSKFNSLVTTTAFTVGLLVIFPEYADAATSGVQNAVNVAGQAELDRVHGTLKGLLTGSINKILGTVVAISSTIYAAIYSKFNVFINGCGIGLGIGAAPGVIESLIGAIF